MAPRQGRDAVRQPEGQGTVMQTKGEAPSLHQIGQVSFRQAMSQNIHS